MSEPTQPRTRRKRVRGHSWLQHGSKHKRELEYVGWALVALVAGTIGLTYVAGRFTTAVGLFAANVVFWAVLVVTVRMAHRKSAPRRLFEFRAADLILGTSLGIAMRLGADVVTQSTSGHLVWPSFATANGSLPSWWWLDGILTRGFLAPIVEEYFFRAFLLVALYAVFRRALSSRLLASVAALLVDSALFLLVHLLVTSYEMTTTASINTFVFSLVAGALVFLTGRFWSALVFHLVFNGTWVLLALIGTAAGATSSVPGLS